MAGKAGKAGSVTTGTPANTYVITGWTYDDSVDLLDDTNSADSGEETSVVGVSHCSGTFTMNYDQTNSYIPTITPGVALITLTLKVDAGDSIVLANAWVESRSFGLTITGMTEVTVNFRGTGVTLGTADDGMAA